jgi:hypothetical protein
MQRTNGITFDQGAFYAGNVNFDSLIQAAIASQNPASTFLDPRFLQDYRFQAPRLARFDVRFRF